MRQLCRLLLLPAFSFLFSCGETKECPGFSDNLLPYIPQESKLVFYNPAGDSLIFNTAIFQKTPAHTEKQNVLSVGGSGSKPYCRSACSLGSSYSTTEFQQLNYSIQVDNEALICTLSVSISSRLPSNDYFLYTNPFSTRSRLFGDTLRLSNFTPTLDPRFSSIVIVHGRGIIAIQDDEKSCLWTR